MVLAHAGSCKRERKSKRVCALLRIELQKARCSGRNPERRRTDNVQPQEIDRIRVRVLPPHCKMIDHDVKSGDRASHLTSVAFCMAAAALAADGTAALGLSPPDPSQHVRNFMAKIMVEPDESLLASYPRKW